MAAPAVATAIYARSLPARALRGLDLPRIHERAFSEGAEIGNGTIVAAYAYLGAGAVVGQGCRIGASAHVEGILGDGVVVERGALVAAGVRIGDGALVSAGSVVLADVPAREVAAGNPALRVA
jgi:acetyltransferase-like isoleucine patch superfamily enzyme